MLCLRTKVKTLAIGRDVCTSKPLRISWWHLCASGYSKFAPCHHDLALANSFSTENMHSCHSEMEISEAVFPRAFSSQVSCMVPPNTCRSGHTGAPASQLIIDLTKRQQCQSGKRIPSHKQTSLAGIAGISRCWYQIVSKVSIS